MINIFEEKEAGLSILLDNLSKDYISKLSSSVVHNVMEGNEYAIEQYVKAKGLSEIANSIMDSLKDLAISESYNYGSDDKIFGCNFQIKSTNASYDFSHDDEWSKLNESLDAIKQKMKAREKQMVDALQYAELIDNNGEVIPKAVIKKESGTTIAILIPKQ